MQDSESLSGATHILLKMHHLWEYLSVIFDNPHKVHKMIKRPKVFVIMSKQLKKIKVR
jgi:hypothetical protein